MALITLTSTARTRSTLPLLALLVLAACVVAPPAESAALIGDVVVVSPGKYIEALVPGSEVTVSLVDVLGKPVSYPSANVGVALFLLDDLNAWSTNNFDPRTNLNTATWREQLTGVDLTATNGTATFHFDYFPGLSRTPGLLWAYYDNPLPGGAAHDSYYAYPEHGFRFFGTPGQSLYGEVVTPIYASDDEEWFPFP